MSTTALRDLIVLPGSDMKTGNSVKESSIKPVSGALDENLDKCHTTKPQIFKCPESANGAEGIHNETGTTNVEIEYIESQNLKDLEDFQSHLTTILVRLDSKDWIAVCEALNHVRQLALFRKEKMMDILNDVIPLVVKSMKNPRSALCKTAIMTSADIFQVYNDLIIESFEPMLVQLLLKSSQDKRFVCAAAEKALVAMTTWLSPNLLLPKLQPNLQHKNPRIRAKASTCVSRSVPRLGREGIEAYGFDKLLNIAVAQLNDQLPESREAARILLLELKGVYESSRCIKQVVESDHAEATVDDWEQFCQSKLSPLSAQAILRVTATKEGHA